MTRRLRLAIVELYGEGLSSLEVAEVPGVRKSTVLKVLKAANVTVRPQGVRYR